MRLNPSLPLPDSFQARLAAQAILRNHFDMKNSLYDSEAMPEYNLSSILPFVRPALRSVKPGFTFTAFVNATWGGLEKAGVPVDRMRAYAENNPDNPEFRHNHDPAGLQPSAIAAWLYIQRRGFATPISRNFPSVVDDSRLELTKRGREWVDAQEPIPELAAEYIAALEKMVPNLDQVVREYVVEGLGSFEHDRFWAAAVMIGAASEKGVYLLGESMRQAFKDPKQTAKLEGFINGRSMNSLFGFIQNVIAQAQQPPRIIPYSVTEGASPHLMSLIEAIRVQRNDAVHPQNASVSADSVRLSYLAFPHALQKLEELRAWFSANPGSL